MEPDPSDPPPHSRHPKLVFPLSPWMWAKAETNPGAVYRMYGDGMVSNEARMGSVCMETNPPLLHTHNRTGPFRPTTALQIPKAGVPASPWMWAKATTNLGAVIRLCGDGMVSNEARMGSIYLHGNPPLLHTYRTTGPFRPTTALQIPKAGVPASP